MADKKIFLLQSYDLRQAIILIITYIYIYLGSIFGMSSPLLKSKDFQMIKNLGGGAYGIVSQISAKHDFALKEINLRDILSGDTEEDEIELDKVKGEYLIMKKNLKNVVKSVGSAYDEKGKKFYFTMELMDQDLDRFISFHYDELKSPLTFVQFQPILFDIVTGLLAEYQILRIISIFDEVIMKAKL